MGWTPSHLIGIKVLDWKWFPPVSRNNPIFPKVWLRLGKWTETTLPFALGLGFVVKG